MAIGDVGNSIISALILDTEGYSPSICRVHGSVYAVAYGDGSSLGRVKTFSIDASGAISAAISTLTFDSSRGVTPSIIKAHDGIFAVAYSGVDTDGFCKTFSITNAGTIGVVIDTLEFETNRCGGEAQNFLHIYGNVFAFAYQGGATSTHLTIKTWSIDTAGNLGAVLSTLTIAVGQNKGVAFVHCTGSLYATLIDQLVENTQLDTFTISDAGIISAVIATAAVDSAGNGNKPQIIPIGGNNYVLTYYEATHRMATRSISPAGVIGAEIDTINLSGSPYSMLSISGGVYVYTYGDGGNWLIRTIAIGADGTIGSEVDNLTGLAGSYAYPHILHHREDIYVCVLTGTPTNDCLAETFTIANAAPLPSDDFARVTGIRHIYKPGFFRMILSLGDVSNTIEIAERKVRKELEIPEQQTPAPPPPAPPEWPEPTAPPKPPARRPAIFPTMPGIVTPPGVFEVPEREEPPTFGEVIGATLRAAVPLGTIKEIWRRITPWEEEAGETFGGEVAERFKSYTKFMRRTFFGGKR